MSQLFLCTPKCKRDADRKINELRRIVKEQNGTITLLNRQIGALKRCISIDGKLKK